MPPLIIAKSQKAWRTACYLPSSMAGRKSPASPALGRLHPAIRGVIFCPAFRIRLFTGFVVKRYKSSRSLITKGRRDTGVAGSEINNPHISA